MEELVNQLIEKVGLDKATAEKVVAFLKEHAAEVPQWLQGAAGQDLLNKAKGSLGGLFSSK
jgi:hypothetical protein